MLSFEPAVELTRGRIVESVHLAAAAVVDSSGHLIASLGDPQLVMFLRSSAKPFQALPFMEREGDRHFGLGQEEIAIMCASHTGSDRHVEVVRGMLRKAGLDEQLLGCGIHQPDDLDAFLALTCSGALPTPVRNNCSGKHTGMLMHARMRGLPLETYLEREHPVQQDILQTFAEMCDLTPGQVEVGIDGCSAPNFAVPLYNAALAYARLCDPRGLPEARAAACRRIVAAMTACPEMVSGPNKLDAVLMQACNGGLVSKGGAEGYLAAGLLPDLLIRGAPGIGVVLKVADGDLPIRSLEGRWRSRARGVIMVEILRQLGALDEAQLARLEAYAARQPILNHRKLVTGESRTVFTLHRL